MDSIVFKKLYHMLFDLATLLEWICSLQNSCIIYYLIKCIIGTLPNINVCVIYPGRKLKLIALFNTFILIHLR